METKDALKQLRQERGMTQDELADKLCVTRQAVSRWETGATTPNVDTLKLMSKLWDVSINTLLGSPRRLICQCCGMPLDDSTVSHEPDGSINEDYCKWCYQGGAFVYSTLDSLLDFLVREMPHDGLDDRAARQNWEAQLRRLAHWQEPQGNMPRK